MHMTPPTDGEVEHIRGTSGIREETEKQQRYESASTDRWRSSRSLPAVAELLYLNLSLRHPSGGMPRTCNHVLVVNFQDVASSTPHIRTCTHLSSAAAPPQGGVVQKVVIGNMVSMLYRALSGPIVFILLHTDISLPKTTPTSYTGK